MKKHWIEIMMCVLALCLAAAIVTQAKEWKKKGDGYEVKTTLVADVDVLTVYNVKQALGVRKALLEKLVCAGLTKADAAELQSVAANLVNVSIGDQLTLVSVEYAEVPIVEKPVDLEPEN